MSSRLVIVLWRDNLTDASLLLAENQASISASIFPMRSTIQCLFRAMVSGTFRWSAALVREASLVRRDARG